MIQSFQSRGVLAYKEKSPPSSSHRDLKALQLSPESPMLIHGDNTPNLGLSWIFEASRARGFVLRSQELQILSFIWEIQPGHLAARLGCAEMKVATCDDLAIKLIILGWNVKHRILQNVDPRKRISEKRTTNKAKTDKTEHGIEKSGKDKVKDQKVKVKAEADIEEILDGPTCTHLMGRDSPLSIHMKT
ncbi:hypothetical protein Tco_0572617 [Tanacetum coccineum]